MICPFKQTVYSKGGTLYWVGEKKDADRVAEVTVYENGEAIVKVIE
jgi:L-lactate utilization protein LutB